MKRTWIYSIAGVIAALVVLIAINYVASLSRGRVDLTEGKLYTLSEGTKALLAKLKDPVRIRYYFTQGEDAIPIQIRVFAKRVEDLLAEYKKAGGDKVVLERLNPQPDSDAEDSANLDGIEPQQLGNGERFYLGLAVNQGDRKTAIPSLSADRERLIEYDLTRAIARVSDKERPVIGVLSPLPLTGNPMAAMMGQPPSPPQVFYTELQRDFTLKRVALDVDRIDDEVKTLIVIHPRGISDRAQYAIDQFVLRGGRLIAFVDPHAYFDQIPGMPGPGGTSSTLDKLFKAWGTELAPDKVVLDLENAAGAGGRVIPTVLALDGPAINRDDIATASIPNLLVPMAGAFALKPAEGLAATVLVHSSKNSQLVDSANATLEGQAAVRDFKPSGTEYPIAIKLAGKFKTAFPEGKPKAEAKPEEKNAKPDAKPAAEAPKPAAPDAPQLNEAKEANTIVLIADSDLINDGAAVSIQEMFGRRIAIPRNGNLAFFQTLVEQMAGNPALATLSSRAVSARPLTVVKQIEAEAQQAYLGKLKDLEDNLNQTKEKLSALEKTKGAAASGAAAKELTPEQQAEVDLFRKRVVETRRELKDVRRELRADTEALEFWTKVANIALIPLLVIIAGITLAIVKRRRIARSFERKRESVSQ